MHNQPNVEYKRTKKRHPSWGKIIILVAVVALAVFGTCYLILDGFKDQNDPTVIVDKVGKHIMLPSGETPEVSTVEGASDLASQPFFQNVKDGDKILIYPKAARIIIYRPSENILVNVGPIVDDSTTPSDSNSATSTPTE